MQESLTEGTVVEPASNEPTGQQPQVNTADVNQEAISNPVTSVTGDEAESDKAAQKQTNKNSGQSDTDDSLTKFAKSQGIDDFESLSDREKKLLKIASDNQKAYRNNSGKKIAAVVDEINSPAEDATETQKLAMEVNKMKYAQTRTEFFSQEGIDSSLEPEMVKILNEKKEQYGADFARTLSQDLKTLYNMARVEVNDAKIEAAREAGRREERESIRKQQTASAPNAHATTSANSSKFVVTPEWIDKEYNPRDPAQRALVDAFYRTQ